MNPYCVQAEAHEESEDAVLQPDGTYLYKGPKGRLETWKERQQRLAHNQRMCFNRSFSDSSKPIPYTYQTIYCICLPTRSGYVLRYIWAQCNMEVFFFYFLSFTLGCT